MIMEITQILLKVFGRVIIEKLNVEVVLFLSLEEVAREYELLLEVSTSLNNVGMVELFVKIINLI